MEFIRRRLQVFVSSTFSDLRDERQAAVEAILTAGHIPAGMELFTAGDQSQMEVIKHWIDESDIYLVIVGGRYGSVEASSGKSYTQLEYEYAVEKEKPLFACVIEEAALERRVKGMGSSAIETDNPREMKAFREQVLTRMVRFWEDSKDIKISVGEALGHFSRRRDLHGWVRPSQQANMPALADEVARLSRENAELRERIGSASTGPDYVGLSFEELKRYLESEGLLDFFARANRSYITSRENHEPITRLTNLGLTAWAGDDYGVTEDGRRFLNRLDALEASGV